jgi:hypothetical protein
LGSLEEKDHSEYLGADKMSLNRSLGEVEGVDWIHLAQGKDWWRALVNTVLILRAP